MKRFTLSSGPGILTAGALFLAMATGGFASPIGQASTANGGAFAGACAGNTTFGGVNDPGSIYNNGVGITYDSYSYFQCNYGNSVGGAMTGASAQNSGNFYGNAWANQSSSSAAPQQVHLQGTNTATTSSAFAGVTANGGWNDSYTLNITDPSVTLTTPVSGYWIVPINVSGSLAVTGLGAIAQASVAAYENNNLVLFDSGDGSAWSFFTANNTLANGAIGSTWDTMDVAYGVDSSLPNMTVNSTILFALPVTFSSNTDTLEAGIYAQIWMTQSSGSPAYPVTESALFNDTIGWGGPGKLVLGGVTYSSDQFSISGTSGTNYEVAFSDTPEPATVVLVGAGLCALAFFRRRLATR